MNNIPSTTNGENLSPNNYSFLTEIKNLTDIGIDNWNIPDELKIDGRILVSPSENFKINSYNGSGVYEISDDVKNQITAYNAKMTEIYEPMNQQLRAVLNTVAQCRTTKRFKAELPQLVNLWPDSVKRKHHAKNNEVDDKPKSEKEAMVDEAAKIIAASVLFDED